MTDRDWERPTSRVRRDLEVPDYPERCRPDVMLELTPEEKARAIEQVERIRSTLRTKRPADRRMP